MASIGFFNPFMNNTSGSGGGGTGEAGQDGRGIVAVTFLESTGGNVAGIEGATDTYQISYTDGTKTTYKVTNGSKGSQGEKGDTGEQGEQGEEGRSIASAEVNASGVLVLTFSDNTVVETGVVKGADGTSVNIIDDLESTDLLPSTGQEKGDSYLINGHLWIYTESTDEGAINGFIDGGNIQGPQGVRGNGIAEIRFKSSNMSDVPGVSGATDTYEIVFTDGFTSTFEVVNGVQGIQGEQGVSIVGATVNDEKHLIIEFSNDTTQDAGKLPQPDQIQADWNVTDETAADFIKNKPKNISDFNDDVHEDILRADFDTLTDEEREGKVYFIKDDTQNEDEYYEDYNQLINKPLVYTADGNVEINAKYKDFFDGLKVAGYSPKVVENADNNDTSYRLDIRDSEHTFTTPNLIGKQGPQGIQGVRGLQGEQGIQGIQGVQGERGPEGYPFLIYKEYTSLDEFSSDDFPQIGLMFMIRADENAESYPVYRYTGDDSNPYSHVVDMATTEGVRGETGPQGPQGEQGIQGEKGEDGNTYKPEIGVINTVDSMYDAVASVELDEENLIAKFNFDIPRGEKGEQGLIGETGADGANGVTYTPSVADGVISWSNDGGLINPDSIDVGQIAKDAAQEVIDDGNLSTSSVWSSQKVNNEIANTEKIVYSSDANECIPALMKTAKYNLINTASNVPNSNYSWVLTAEHIKLSTGQYYRIVQTINGTKSDGGTAKYIRTATSSDDVTWTWSDWSINALLDDTASSTTSTYSSSKINKEFGLRHFGTDSKTLYLKLQLGTMTTYEPITVTDQYGGQIEILGMYDISTYKSVKVIRHSYGDWTTHDGTVFTSTTSGDGNYKIRSLYYCPTDNNYYLEIRQYAYIGVKGAPNSTMVATLPTELSEMTLIPESKFATTSDLAKQTADRQVKTFDNTSSSTEKWYKLCSALTGGIGCNIKLTASRADSTATVQYFSALFRDNRYRYTSSHISREKTVYESELIAEYSSYIIADANNDIWVHVPSYGKAIIEIDTRTITIDGTMGTPVEDYVYNSFDHRLDGKINDSTTNTTSTWSSSQIASRISNATAIKYKGVINATSTTDTGWSLSQGESHFYGRLLQLDGHLGSKSLTFSFLLFVKANYDKPTTVYVTQLAGMDDDRSNIAHTTYFELGVSSNETLTIKNKSAVVASYRFI